jgi:hypothetical protein
MKFPTFILGRGGVPPRAVMAEYRNFFLLSAGFNIYGHHRQNASVHARAHHRMHGASFAASSLESQEPMQHMRRSQEARYDP